MALHVLDEANRCLGCKKPMCQQGCPIHTNIPEVIRLLKANELDAAGRMLFENNPLTTVCSLVCNHENQCEGHCIRNRMPSHDPVHFSIIEDYISTTYANKMTKGPAPRNGMKAAVVGAGPAGLTIAVLLARWGYDITIFDARDKIGGVMRYGIPNYRLPDSVLDDFQYRHLELKGIHVRPNTTIGKTITIDELFEQGYQAVFVGSGAGLPMFMGIPGETLSGVYSANEYLTRVNLMKAYLEEYDTPIKKSRAVAVVGGGNVAMDAARCAKRIGAEHVYVVYRRSEAEMPARNEEIHHAREEGIEFHLLNNPTRILSDGKGSVAGMECIKMELGEPDASGRRRPVEVPGSEFVLDVDTVIMSLGTTPNPLIRSTTPGLETNRKGCLVVHEDTMETTRPHVYAGGDAVTGAATVILAMGAGKRAAKAIHEALSAKNED